MPRPRFKKGDRLLWPKDDPKEYEVLKYVEGEAIGRYKITQTPVPDGSYIEIVGKQPVLSVARSRLDTDAYFLERSPQGEGGGS